MLVKVSVIDFDGTSFVGFITKGDRHGVFVNGEKDTRFFDFANVRALIVHQ